jgi:hypothetical protein
MFDSIPSLRIANVEIEDVGGDARETCVASFVGESQDERMLRETY